MSEVIHQDGSYTKCLTPAFYHVNAGATVRLVQSYEPVEYHDQGIYPGLAFPDGSRTEFFKHGLYHLSPDASVTMVAPPQQEDYNNQFAVPGANPPTGEEGSTVPETGIDYEDQHPGFQFDPPSIETMPNQASQQAMTDFFASSSQNEQLAHTNMLYSSITDAPSTGQAMPGQTLVPQADMGHMPSSSQVPAAAPLLPIQPATAPTLPAPQADKYIARGLLPDATMAQLNSLPYETTWLANNDIRPSILDGFTSKMKFEVLFGHGVFRVGDVFKADNVIGTILSNVEAILTSFPTHILNAYPDFQIRNTVTRGTSMEYGCRGVSQLYRAMSAPPYSQIKGFATFRVYRNGVELGNLYHIRQGLEVWIEEKDLWMRRTTGKGRTRRAPNKPKVPDFGGQGGSSSGGEMGGGPAGYSGGGSMGGVMAA